MEENKVPDTQGEAPQSNEQANTQGSADSGFSFDEVIFGDKNKSEEATPSPLGGTPADTPVEGQKQADGQTYQAKNDDKRFEYWQSRAQKLENEMAKMEPVVRNANMMAAQQQQQPVQPQAQQQEEQFPDPPEKPRRPVGYNREAAYTDPSSASAQYDNDVEEWRDKMDEYNSLRVQYSEAVVGEQYQQMEEARRAEHARRQQATKNAQDRAKVSEYVQANYGLSPDEAGEFIQKFSNPSSITIDNLVGLYNLQRGQGGGAPVNQTQAPPVSNTPNPGIPNGPSDAFVQTQRAQQVPQPMGVMASGNNPNDITNQPNPGKGFISDLANFTDNKKPF